MKRASCGWLVGIIIFVGLMILTYRFMGDYLTLDWFQSHSRALRVHVDQQYFVSAVLFSTITFLSALLSLPITIFLIILGGFLFGILWGTVYAVIGTAIGCTIAFLIFRHFCAQQLRERYAVRFAPLFRQLERYGSMYLLILYFLTIVPFFVINAFAALTSLSTRKFFLLTICGNLPLFLVYAFIGRRMSEINSLSDIFSAPVLVVFALLLVLAIGSVMIKQHMLHHEEQEKSQ